LFSSYFNSVFTPPSPVYPDNFPFLYYELPSNCNFSVADVKAGYVKLKNAKSIGSDGLADTFLYNFKSVLCVPLWLIFRRFLNEGIFPSIRKISSITPILKSGDKSNVRNYRPIFILSHIAKLFEFLVLLNIQPSINAILIKEQYGFRPGRSAAMNLTIFNNFVLEAFDNKSQVDVIFTDFAKAFDRTNHNFFSVSLQIWVWRTSSVLVQIISVR